MESFPFHELDGFKFLSTGDPLVDWHPKREWTSTDGKTLNAKVVAMRGEIGDFELGKGKVTKIPLTRLSQEDQIFLREWDGLSEYFDTSFKRERRVRGEIKADMFDGQFAKEGKIHETRNFRFECDVPLTKAIAKDFSRLFEVTYKAVAELPIGLAPYRPDGRKILVRLFSKQASYLRAGGASDAAGIYLLKERLVLVPLASLGIVRGGNGKFRKEDFDPATLIHETTHAVMHQWLRHMPLWLSEGLAEYIAALPYKDGVLDYTGHEAGMNALAAKKFGGNASKYDLIEPKSFVHLEHRVFMGEPKVKEELIRLPIVEPYQIELIKAGASSANRSEARNKETSGQTNGLGPTIVKPLLGDPSPDVIRRYVSSMLLVRHLLKEDPAVIRKYLFSLLHGEWTRRNYLEEWRKAHKLHIAGVNDQISAFNVKIGQLSAEIDKFNAAVTRRNAGEAVEIPKRPEKLVPPKALPVPEILANPKSASELSRRGMRARAIESNLKLPQQLNLPKED